MEGGVYRAGGAAAGLPLPRRNLGRFSAAIVVAAVLALVGPLLVFALLGGGAGADVTTVWRHMKEGGVASMSIVLVLNVAGALAIGVLGALLARGRRVPAAALFFVAGMPLGQAMALANQALGHVEATLGIEPIELRDPLTKHWILAEGLSEVMLNDVLGALATGFLAIVVSIACASAVASIDLRQSDAWRAGWRDRCVIASGLVWLGVTLFRADRTDGRGCLSALAIAVVLPFVVLAARRASLLRDWHDPVERRAANSAFIIAGLSTLLAVLALEYAVRMWAFSRGLVSLAGYDTDGLARVATLRSIAATARADRLSSVLHLFLGGITFTVALAPARPRPSRGSIAVVVFGGALFLGAFALGRIRIDASRRVTNDLGYGAPRVDLPKLGTVAGDSRREIGTGFPLEVPSGARDDGQPGCRDGPDTYYGSVIHARRDATIAMVRAAVPDPRRCTSRLHVAFIAERIMKAETDDHLGDLSTWLGGVALFSGHVNQFESPPIGRILRVQSRANGEFVIEDSPSNSAAIDGVVYDFRPDETVEHALGIVDAVEERRHLSHVHRVFRCSECPH